MTEPPKPLPRVSAKHYDPEPPRVAKVRFRIKGQTDGPIYQGQVKFKPCDTCGGGK